VQAVAEEKARVLTHGLGDSTELIELAKSVDMTIMSQLRMAAGRPVLVVPYAGNFETVGKRILVAWDGTREANRALNDAPPLLEESQSATVMFVGANERELEQHLPAIERIAGHLQRHGVNVVPEGTVRGGLAVSDILLSRAADLAADLIVTGGYHHSQLREALIVWRPCRFSRIGRSPPDKMICPAAQRPPGSSGRVGLSSEFRGCRRGKDLPQNAAWGWRPRRIPILGQNGHAAAALSC
jgi:nucleotide-binding universal stress UspA family protein